MSPDGRYDRDGDGPARPDQQRRDAQAVRHRRPTRSPTSSSTRSPPLGPPGPRLAAGRRASCCTCATTVTAPRARPGSTPVPRTPRRRGAVTGPGYLIPAWSPDGKYIAATKTSAFGTDIVILNAANGAELARLTDDGNSWAPTWSPRGDQIAYLHVAGQVIDLRMAQLDGSGARTGRSRTRCDLTTAAGLDGVSRPDWYVPAADLPAATPAAQRASPVAVRDLVPRPARRADRGDGHGPVRGHRPRPRRPARRGSPRRSTAWSASPGCSSRRRSRTRRRSSPTSPSSRRSARRGSPRSSGCAPRSRPTSRSSRTRSGATSAPRPPGRRWRCSTCSAPTPSPSARTSARRRSRRCSRATDRFAYVLCRTSNPGAGELQAPRGGRAIRRRPGASRAAVGPGRASRRGLGTGRHRRPRGRGDGARGARRDPRARAGPRVPRAGRRRPGRGGRARARGRPGDGRAGRRTPGRRPARQRLPRASPGRPWRPPPRGRRRTPASASSAAAAEWAKRLAVLP